MKTNTWYTSDLHFSHKNICDYTDRGRVTNKQDHDEWLIALWNNTVSKDDVVWHLGDFMFGHKLKSITDRLNGQINFIKGNHDSNTNLTDLCRNSDGRLKYHGHYLEDKSHKDVHLVLHHFPIISWHKQAYGSIHLHGHCHGNLTIKHGRMLDVGIDNAYNLFGKHCFFHLDDIVELMNNQSITVADSHRHREGE